MGVLFFFILMTLSSEMLISYRLWTNFQLQQEIVRMGWGGVTGHKWADWQAIRAIGRVTESLFSSSLTFICVLLCTGSFIDLPTSRLIISTKCIHEAAELLLLPWLLDWYGPMSLNCFYRYVRLMKEKLIRLGLSLGKAGTEWAVLMCCW